jgi:hypothetical protein
MYDLEQQGYVSMGFTLLWRLAAFIRVYFTMIGLRGVYRNMGMVTQA